MLAKFALGRSANFAACASKNYVSGAIQQGSCFKLDCRDCHEESLTVSVSPTGKGEWKTVGCDDDIRVCFLGAEITVYGSSENRSNECTYCRQSA